MGGMGMIRIADFLDSLKISWICRYVVVGINDHWCDILDTRLDLTPETVYLTLKAVKIN